MRGLNLIVFVRMDFLKHNQDAKNAPHFAELALSIRRIVQLVLASILRHQIVYAKPISILRRTSVFCVPLDVLPA